MSETERETGAKRKTGRKRNSTFPGGFPVLGGLLILLPERFKVTPGGTDGDKNLPLLNRKYSLMFFSIPATTTLIQSRVSQLRCY